MNLAVWRILEEEPNPERKRQLYDELCGVLSSKRPPEDEGAPSWWRGEEDAYENTMASLGNLPMRRR